MKRVLVAMSGGVDSSVAAALLKKQDFFVMGGFMKNFSPESWTGVLDADCPWEQDFADVQAVCEKLGVECRSFNFEKEYREQVLEYFFNEYAAGRTPNPDVMCNKAIKFKLFLEKALALGFDYIATGHYARIQDELSLPRFARDDRMVYQLLKGLDPKKDQSYFLYTLNQHQLSRTLFPIGEYAKPQVRELARKFGLPNAEKKDSQGLCFVGHVNVREFLKQRIPEKVGEIVDPSGRVIGTHPGAWYYTIGQRHGLGIGGGKPYYVVAKDTVSNTINVTQNNSPPPPLTLRGGTPPLKLRGGREGLYSKTATIKDVHWINEEPQLPLKCQAKIRYQQPDQDCNISSLSLRATRSNPRDRHGATAPRDDKVTYIVEFRRFQFAIAPGQSIVFYDGDIVLGGGIIQ